MVVVEELVLVQGVEVGLIEVVMEAMVFVLVPDSGVLLVENFWSYLQWHLTIVLSDAFHMQLLHVSCAILVRNF